MEERIDDDMKYFDFKQVLLIASFFCFSFFLGINLNLPSLDMGWMDGDHDKPNVIIVDIDRMTESHMSCYGYHRNTTPNMCRFGEENIMVENAISHSGWTGSSLASLFSGQYVGTHDVKAFNDTLENESRTMAEVFSENGYSTVAYPSIPTKDKKFMNREYNFQQGFDSYGYGHYNLKDHEEEIDSYIRSNDDRPFFMFVQSYKPHRYLHFNATYRDYNFQNESYSGVLHDMPPRAEGQVATDIVRNNGQYQVLVSDGENVNITERDIEHVKATYDDLLYDTDQSFGDLIRLLKDRGVYSESIIILTANHGEVIDTMSFSGNERFGHGVVYEDQINVPFMMHVPEREKPLDIDRQIEFVDVFPTLLELTDTEFGDERELMLQGESFGHLIEGDSDFPLKEDGVENPQENLTMISDYGYKIHALRNNSWKYVRFNPDQKMLFNLEKDPKEHNNVAEEYPKLTDKLSQELDQKQQRNQILHSRIYG